jgi:hypothetical protein
MATFTCGVYKHGQQLGTGTLTDGSASITSYSGTAPGSGRNVQISVTQAGTHVGKSFKTRIVGGSGTATLTMSDTCPFL